MSELMQLIHKIFPAKTSSTTPAVPAQTPTQAAEAALVSPFQNFVAQVDKNAAAASANGGGTTAAVVTEIKQAASDAVGLLKTGVDTGIDDLAQGAADAFTAYLTGIAGPIGVLVSPADHALAQKGAAIAKSVIDEALLAFQAKLAPTVESTATVVATSPGQPISNPPAPVTPNPQPAGS